MSNRGRDRGTTVITPEERVRRVKEAKSSIRETATFTPALLGRIESRIDANAFRRCISDNTIYQSLCNSLKDKNLPERERRPDLVDYLALEAIVAVNYDGEYNKVLKDLFIRCHTAVWVDKAVLAANHEWYQDSLSDARKFVKTLINKVDSQLLEIILEDLETTFWRETIKDHVLYKKILEKLKDNRDLSQRDVLTAVALNGGKYPTEVFRHLIVHQNSSMCQWGNNVQAQHALYEDDEFQDTRAQNTIVSDTMTNLESFADAMHNKQKSNEIRKRVRELKELMKDDLGLLRHTQGGRVQKSAGGVGGRVVGGGGIRGLSGLIGIGGMGSVGGVGGVGAAGGVGNVRSTSSTSSYPIPTRPTPQRLGSEASSSGGLFMRQDGDKNGLSQRDQSQMESEGGRSVSGGGMGGLGGTGLKREAFSPVSNPRTLGRSGSSY
ncbi:hypothetical protein CORC01_03776 [Colletotrichum orchidophilum]|uniref:Uncharacterized protein n=1 Tax=Colletotrichum orchidophilum TaxID=1209926 RepID=A0A1G4BI14_9PEZI|nr:uncharacterized protein CORC01_03776 [Colletotrichum orchidophilum]OHF00948.1 hypothetical protein CORC01_03776 [Colletotrichum orchidophilum]